MLIAKAVACEPVACMRGSRAACSSLNAPLPGLALGSGEHNLGAAESLFSGGGGLGSVGGGLPRFAGRVHAASSM